MQEEIPRGAPEAFFLEGHPESGSLLCFKVKAALLIGLGHGPVRRALVFQGNEHIGERSTASIDDFAPDPDWTLTSEPCQAGEKKDRREGQEIESESTELVLDHLNAGALRG